MIRTTADGVVGAIPSGRSDRVHVLTPEASIRLAYGREVSVVVDEGAFRDMARHCLVPLKASSECIRRDETRCIWLYNKNRREKRSMTESSRWVEQKVSVSVLSRMRWYALLLRTILRKPCGLLLEPKRVHVKMLLTLQNTREQFGAKS